MISERDPLKSFVQKLFNVIFCTDEVLFIYRASDGPAYPESSDHSAALPLL